MVLDAVPFDRDHVGKLGLDPLAPAHPLAARLAAQDPGTRRETVDKGGLVIGVDVNRGDLDDHSSLPVF